MYPKLGASGSNYARSVVGTHLRSTILPDPELIYESMSPHHVFYYSFASFMVW